MSSSIPDPVPDGATDAQLRHIINYWKIEAEHADACNWQLHKENFALKEENATLLAKVDWLMKADKLIVWNGTEWQIRREESPR